MLSGVYVRRKYLTISQLIVIVFCKPINYKREFSEDQKKEVDKCSIFTTVSELVDNEMNYVIFQWADFLSSTINNLFLITYLITLPNHIAYEIILMALGVVTITKSFLHHYSSSFGFD